MFVTLHLSFTVLLSGLFLLVERTSRQPDLFGYDFPPEEDRLLLAINHEVPLILVPPADFVVTDLRPEMIAIFEHVSGTVTEKA